MNAPSVYRSRELLAEYDHLLRLRLKFQCQRNPVQLAQVLGIDLDPWQVQALKSGKSRVIFLCTRQAGKSTLAALMSLWTALFRPGALIILVSRGQRQAGVLFRKVVHFLRLYKKLVQDVPLETINLRSLELKNGGWIVSLPANAETVRGYSAPKLIICDEAAFIPDDVHHAITPMQATVLDGSLWLLSTPYGKRGWFYETWIRPKETSQEWEKISVLATQCKRIPQSFLDEERRSKGEWIYKQEYMCEFVERVDSVFTQQLISNMQNDDDEFDDGLEAL